MYAWDWIKKHIDIRFVLTPLGKVNRNYRTHRVGYSDYYIFGIRIARIQKTEPWD